MSANEDTPLERAALERARALVAEAIATDEPSEYVKVAIVFLVGFLASRMGERAARSFLQRVSSISREFERRSP